MRKKIKNNFGLPRPRSAKRGGRTSYFRLHHGFSLLEVMVAIFIIIIGLLGVLALISTSISGGASSTSRLIAANLAQEGIEVVKNMREAAFVADGTWNIWHSLGDTRVSTGNWSVQYNSNSLDTLWNNFLKFDAASGLYSYDFGIDTSFRRAIILDKISDNQLRVSSLVTWTDRNQTQSITVEDMLWNWR